MNTYTLKEIDRRLNLLLTEVNADDKKENTDDKETNRQIYTAVTMLKTVCNNLLRNALPRTKDLSSIEGKRMSENIDNAIRDFLATQPMATLSNDNKIKVISQAKEEYEKHYNTLFFMQHQGRWDTYERRTYDTLVSALQSLEVRMSKKD